MAETMEQVIVRYRAGQPISAEELELCAICAGMVSQLHREAHKQWHDKLQRSLDENRKSW